jgi:hypothetical protein
VRPGRSHDLRDDVAGALDDHPVALADLLAVDVLLVVEGRARDHDAADVDGLHDRPRIEGAGAADADRDREQLRLGGHRRPLVRTRPPRSLMERAETLLLFERVDLDHDPVDLVVQIGAAPFPFGTGLRDLLDRLETLGVRIDPEAPLAQPLERLEVRVGRDALAVARAVDPN